MTALLHPEADLDWKILIHILFRPSLVLIGEPGVESFECKTLAYIICLHNHVANIMFLFLQKQRLNASFIHFMIRLIIK